MLTSLNFDFLREEWPDFTELCAFAEHYAYSDPAASLVKLRTFAERMVHWLYDAAKLEKPYVRTLDSLSKDLFNKGRINQTELNMFDTIRLAGNTAAHQGSGTSAQAINTLETSYGLAQWFFVTVRPKKAPAIFPAFTPPSQKMQPLADSVQKEQELQSLMDQLDMERSKVKAAQIKIEELRAASSNAISVLKLTEEETRTRLIDTQLAAAGWSLSQKEGEDTEVKVLHQPTTSGIGYADYVLWDDNGKPLAVIEAKRTAEDASKGKTQARCYADGLEKEYGQRPVIFYTNGYDIFIWDDAQKYPPRKLYGFYSKDSLQYLVQQRTVAKPLSTIALRDDIAGRLYQTSAIHSAFADFEKKKRHALFVLATGTGKTRVSVSLTEALTRGRWAKRVLFLCDRVELRKQAKNAFSEFLDEPAINVTASTYTQRENRLFFATYPAMQKVYQSFDVGFFDLIIADESHRSIYNIYGDLFKYFDCLQVGLTATPRTNISHNTYKLFECEDSNPTSYYSYEDGVEDNFLVPFEVYTHTTNFQREGIKYKDLTEEQINQLEDDGFNAEELDYDKQHVDKQIYNKDTNRKILRNLMENGIRNATGQHVGKSIIFARNHKHAMLLSDLFNELYPQYGGAFCQVIDNYDPRAEQLIDDFKDPNHELTIAVSVDMLDTGIDVPEVVNLTFAKPVKSYVKFWQMIGRGTRLCADLFGAGKDKQLFRIFDHWDNFAFFEEDATEAESAPTKSLMQQLFEARIDLAEAALKKGEAEIFNIAIDHIRHDIHELPEESIAVRDNWKIKHSLEQQSVLIAFRPETVQQLRKELAPLMQWVNLRGRSEAKLFDLLMTRLETEQILGNASFDDLRARVQNQVAQLPMHLNQVRKKADTIKQVEKADFWASAAFEQIEHVRNELRGIMQYKQVGERPEKVIPIIDIEDGDEQFARRKTTLTTVDMEAYRRRVHEVLEPLFTENPTLKKIRLCEPITPEEFSSLASLVLTQHPDVDLMTLQEFYPASAPLTVVLGSIVGMDIEVVKANFADFAAQYGGQLSPVQRQFIQTLQRLISNNGAIKVGQLYEAPFTTFDSDGLDGVFEDNAQIDALLDIIKTFDPTEYGDTERV